MSSTQARDRAIQLAKRDTPAALAAARTVDDPWFRAQALAWVARFAPEPELESVIRQAMAACDKCADPYKQIKSAAWPIRALVERGLRSKAQRELSACLSRLHCVEPASSRSEATYLLYQASFALGVETRSKLLHELCAAYASDPHWRCQRNFLGALAMLPDADRDLRSTAIAALPDDKTRTKAQRVAPEASAPRAFFW